MECSIRPWRMEDAPALAQALNSKKVQDNLRDGLPYPYTERDAAAYIATMLAAEPSAVFAFAITAENKAVGSIGAFRQGNIHSRTAELGYYIAEPYWGKGLCTAAVRDICRYLFTQTDILRVFAEPFANNAGSCRVLEKAGFTLEGVMRQNAVKNGAILNMKLYARLREDGSNHGC